MILYVNHDRSRPGEAYDETYLQDPDRFGHVATFRVLERVFDDAALLAAPEPFRCLDVGCGQGQVLARVREIVTERAPERAAGAAFVGLDMSAVAVRQCEERCPEAHWIVDAFQDFLARSDHEAAHAGRYRLVINKGGLTSVGSADEYRTMLEGVRTLLGPGGAYLFVQSRSFYQVWSNEHCAGWNTDIFEIAAEVFGPPEEIEERTWYAHLHRAGATSAGAGTRSPHAPRRVTFDLSDGSARTVFVSGDALFAERLARLRATPDQERPLRVAPSRGVDEKIRHRAAAQADRAEKQFVPGRARLLLPGMRLRLAADVVVRPFPAILAALADRLNVAPDGEICRRAGHYVQALPRWSEVRSDVLLLGPGLEDHGIDPDTGQTIVDLDGFRNRLAWVLDNAVEQVAERVVYLATVPVRDFADPRSGVRYERGMARSFADEAADLCAERSVPFALVAPGRFRPTADRMTRALVDALVDLLPAGRGVTA